MTPNLFIHCNYRAEDFFSNSLAYIVNLFPAIGQQLIRRIAVLAGQSPDFFGDFGRCEFVGQEFPTGHTCSRPDLIIVCSRRSIYLENKLESPLSLDQMQRHAALTAMNQNFSLIFVSNIHHENSALRQLPGYLHPEQADHYCWVDFLPAFEHSHKSNSVSAHILADFEDALKANGMIGRSLKGAEGSLYTRNSPASHLALDQLWTFLDGLGFKLARKAPKETTIRAYAKKHRHYPLLNPRFSATAAWLDESLDKECLDFTVISKGDGAALDRHLGQFQSTRQCAFVPRPFEAHDDYYYHGHFVLPVTFGGKGNKKEIAFETLRQPMTQMLEFLRNEVP